jgi:hypothetical protein
MVEKLRAILQKRQPASLPEPMSLSMATPDKPFLNASVMMYNQKG